MGKRGQQRDDGMWFQHVLVAKGNCHFFFAYCSFSAGIESKLFFSFRYYLTDAPLSLRRCCAQTALEAQEERCAMCAAGPHRNTMLGGL